MIAIAIWLVKIVKLINKNQCFSPKFSVVFDTKQLRKRTMDLIDHHSYDVKFHPLFSGGTTKGLEPKLTELFEYSSVDTFLQVYK